MKVRLTKFSSNRQKLFDGIEKHSEIDPGERKWRPSIAFCYDQIMIFSENSTGSVLKSALRLTEGEVN